MNTGSVERRVFGLNDLPRFSPYSGQIHTVRGFEVDRSVLTRSSQFFAFREGLALPEVARKIAYGGIFIPLQELKDIGIVDRGVKRDILRAAIGNSEYMATIDKLELRKGEERTADNLICAVLGKVGRESKVIKPFDPKYAFPLYKDRPQEFSALAKSYTDFLGREKLEDFLLSRYGYVLALAGKQISGGSIKSGDEFIEAVVKESIEGRFVDVVDTLAGLQLKEEPLSLLESYFMAIWARSLYSREEDQGSFMAQALGFSALKLPKGIKEAASITDPRSYFIAEAGVFLYGNNSTMRGSFIAGGQQAIVNDRRTVISDFGAPRGNYLTDDPYKHRGIPIT